MLAVLLLSPAFWHVQPARTPCCAHRCPAPALQIRPGGDLEGGLDAERNSDVSALKRLFYSTSAADEPGIERTDADVESLPTETAVADKVAAEKLGLYLDIPLCRWSMVFLPHQQARHRGRAGQIGLVIWFLHTRAPCVSVPAARSSACTTTGCHARTTTGCR